jgi:hypothetical protein
MQGKHDSESTLHFIEAFKSEAFHLGQLYTVKKPRVTQALNMRVPENSVIHIQTQRPNLC